MSPTIPDMTDRPDIVLDIERLTVNCNGNQEIMTELLQHLCQKSCPKWILGIEKGIQNKDSEAIREVCHGMKGACATIFAWRLSNIALEFEYLARDGDMLSIHNRMSELRQRFSEVDSVIKNDLVG